MVEWIIAKLEYIYEKMKNCDYCIDKSDYDYLLELYDDLFKTFIEIYEE